MMDDGSLLERIGAAQAILGSVRRGEVLSEKHWTLVYLLQHPDWRGEGILVETRAQYGHAAAGTVLISDLAFEARIHLNRDVALDGVIPLALNGVNLTQLEASFRMGN